MCLVKYLACHVRNCDHESSGPSPEDQAWGTCPGDKRAGTHVHTQALLTDGTDHTPHMWPLKHFHMNGDVAETNKI